jgi:hypothetical protein
MAQPSILSNIGNFVRDLARKWGALVSGSFSVPFTIFGFLADQKYQQAIWWGMAGAAVLFSYYLDHTNQKRKIEEFEERLRAKIKFIGIHEAFNSANVYGLERHFELEIKNDSGMELTNCLAKITAIKLEKFPMFDGTPASDWTSVYAAHLPVALRTKRNKERDGGGPFNLRAGETKKISLCSRLDGPKSDTEMHWETPQDQKNIYGLKHCEIEIQFYGSATPTIERFDLDVNDKGELRVIHREQNQATLRPPPSNDGYPTRTFGKAARRQSNIA